MKVTKILLFMKNKMNVTKMHLFLSGVLICGFIFVYCVWNPLYEQHRQNAVVEKIIGTLQCDFEERRKYNKVIIVFTIGQEVIKGIFNHSVDKVAEMSIRKLCLSQPTVTLFYREFYTFVYTNKAKRFERLVTTDGQVINRSQRYL